MENLNNTHKLGSFYRNSIVVSASWDIWPTLAWTVPHKVGKAIMLWNLVAATSLVCNLLNYLCPALETINSGWFTPLTQSIKPNYLVFFPHRRNTTVSLETYPVTIDHLPSHFFSAAHLISLASLSAFTITTVLFYWINKTLTFSAFSWMLHNHTTGVLTHWIHHYTLGTVCFTICAAHRGVLSCTYSVTCAFILTRFLVFHTLSKWMTGWYAN